MCVFPYNPNVQGLKEQIDSRLSMVQEIRFEPRLLAEEDDRLKHGSQISQLLYQLTFYTPKSVCSLYCCFVPC